jgi:hypothetical protein
MNRVHLCLAAERQFAERSLITRTGDGRTAPSTRTAKVDWSSALNAAGEGGCVMNALAHSGSLGGGSPKWMDRVWWNNSPSGGLTSFRIWALRNNYNTNRDINLQVRFLYGESDYTRKFDIYRFIYSHTRKHMRSIIINRYFVNYYWYGPNHTNGKRSLFLFKSPPSGSHTRHHRGRAQFTASLTEPACAITCSLTTPGPQREERCNQIPSGSLTVTSSFSCTRARHQTRRSPSSGALASDQRCAQSAYHRCGSTWQTLKSW